MEHHIHVGGDGGRRVTTCTADIQDKTIINRIMLRFRPIAPKPIAGDTSCGNRKTNEGKGVANCGRTKRKYVRVKEKKKKKKKDQEVVQTDLSLAVDRAVERDRDHQKLRMGPQALFDFNMDAVDLTRRSMVTVVVETWVTVESVTGTCMVGLSGSTDVEKMRSLETDTCPGFISDGGWSVRWVNEAYKRMVRVRDDDDEEGVSPEVRVCLVIKEKFLPVLGGGLAAAFGCWVRLQYSTWREKEKVSQIVPCDVWKMEFGGFAWRMDVKAALSLGI